jgi:hypothetical protein
MPEYFIIFNYAPTPQLQFFLSKNPQFNNIDDAYAALANYEFEYGVRGVVMGRTGLAVPPANPHFIMEDIPL